LAGAAFRIGFPETLGEILASSGPGRETKEKVQVEEQFEFRKYCKILPSIKIFPNT
jgi:hypothetical protein